MSEDKMRVDFVIQRIDDLKIASDLSGKNGVGMVFTAPDGDGTVTFGLSVESVQTLYRALVEMTPPPHPVLPRQ